MGNEDVRNFVNAQRLFCRLAVAGSGLSMCFKGQVTVKEKSSLVKPVLPLMVVAKQLPDGVRLIPATVIKHYDFSNKLDHGVVDSPHLERQIEWWIERRFGEPIISFKTVASPAEICNVYGPSIRDACNGRKVELVVENYVSDRWLRIRQPLFAPPREEPQPLVVIMQPHDDNNFVATPTVPTHWPDPDFHVIDEDIDPTSPLGTVHWRQELRGSEQIYCSRFQCTRKKALEVFGDHIGPMVQGKEFINITIENYFSESWRSIRTPVGPSFQGEGFSPTEDDWREARKRMEFRLPYQF